MVAILTVISYRVSHADDTLDLDLAELVKTKVTSFSRTEQNAFSVPGAVYVLTDEEIRNSPARTIPDLLRQVPGLNVTQTASGQYAISARGTNGVFSNKLLVLLDGQSLYESTFSGTLWECVFTPLEDVERIEIIRGPGASAWGANAVNGVINIITKSATDTKDVLIQGGGGNFERSFGTVRKGGTFGEKSSWRASAQWDERGSTKSTTLPSHIDDSISRKHVQFRGDFGEEGSSHYTQQLRMLRIDLQFPVTRPELSEPTFRRVVPEAGFGETLTLLGRLDQQYSSVSTSRLQWYLESFRVGDFSFINQRRDTADVDYQITSSLIDHHLTTTGIHSRVYKDNVQAEYISWNPQKSTQSLVDAFIQHDIGFFGNKAHLLIGTKVEYNDFTGFEYQPTARGSFSPSSGHFIWAGVSRAVRTPGRSLTGASLPLDPVQIPDSSFLLQPVGTGNTRLNAEALIATELGYRFEPSKKFNVDTAFFVSKLSHLYNLRAGTIDQIYQSDNPLISRIPLNYVNEGSLSVRGIEFSTTYHPSSILTLGATYTYVIDSASPLTGPLDTRFPDSAPNTLPLHQGTFKSSLTLPYDLSVSTLVRVYGHTETPSFNFTDDASIIPGFAQLDQRIDWQFSPSTMLFVSGRNLLGDGQVEFNPAFFQAEQRKISRSVFGGVTYRY
jgi:iron complex outermembrane recepter protein